MSELRFCIQQRLGVYRAAITLPLWPITRVRPVGPEFLSYEGAASYAQSIKPRKDRS